MEKTGKNILSLSPITIEPHSVPDELMCKHGGLNWLLTLQGLSCTPALSDSASSSPLSLFPIQRGMSASMPTPNTAGSASRPEPNVAGVKTQYVNQSCQL